MKYMMDNPEIDYDGQLMYVHNSTGTARLTKCFHHPIFGLSYYDPNRRVNVFCAHKILTDSNNYRVKVDTFDAFEVMVLPKLGFDGAAFKTSLSHAEKQWL